MFSNDQFKGYMDLGGKGPIPGPNLAEHYLLLGTILVSVITIAVIGWTWRALLIIGPVAAVALSLALVLNSHRPEPQRPTDYR